MRGKEGDVHFLRGGEDDHLVELRYLLQEVVKVGADLEVDVVGVALKVDLESPSPA